jgi:hypothetical protein
MHLKQVLANVKKGGLNYPFSNRREPISYSQPESTASFFRPSASAFFSRLVISRKIQEPASAAFTLEPTQACVRNQFLHPTTFYLG